MTAYSFDEPEPVFCDRCGIGLQPGTGSFYWVRIAAIADPSPPTVGAEDPEAIRARIERLLAQLEDTSAQEAMDQVLRRLNLCLCVHCYQMWIEDPVGDGSAGEQGTQNRE